MTASELCDVIDQLSSNTYTIEAGLPTPLFSSSSVLLVGSMEHEVGGPVLPYLILTENTSSMVPMHKSTENPTVWQTIKLYTLLLHNSNSYTVNDC